MPPTPTRAFKGAATGRVNLIGEHTDYNGGFVLPAAIPLWTTVELHPRDDQHVTAHSHTLSADASFVVGEEQPTREWFDYVQGVTWALRREGHAIRGFDVEIWSDVPLGAGLSSSASLEVALLRAITSAFELKVDDVQIARLGQSAENGFVGAQSGIMDQMAVSVLGGLGRALFLDTRSLEYREIPLPSSVELVVIDSGVSHRIGGEQSEYNSRRAECEEAARLLGVPQLRDVSGVQQLTELPSTLQRRARHVLTEDDRVLQAVEALEAGDVLELGELFYASHASMRDDFEVSTPEVDMLVDAARADPDVVGARLTGGGFGGAVVILAHDGRGREVGKRVVKAYAERSGQKPTLLVPTETNAA